jgi:hypothetical protein
MNGHVSPRLGVRFEQTADAVTLYGPDGRKFQAREERVAEIAEELRKTAMAFEDERQRAIDAEWQVEAERAARATLAAKLRELGVDPDELLRPAS